MSTGSGSSERSEKVVNLVKILMKVVKKFPAISILPMKL